VTGLEQIALKIGVSALLAGAVGAEREWTGKWAGLRTHMLIAVGSTLLTHLSHSPSAADPSRSWDDGRIAAQIVSGIGFIGAGTILQSRGAVHGLTTAAGLWVACAIGIAVGGDFYWEAAITAGALLLILVALRPIEKRLLRTHRRTVVLQLKAGQKPSQLAQLLEECGMETETVSVSHHGRNPVVTLCFRGSAEDGRRFVQEATLNGYDAVDETETSHPPWQPPWHRSSGPGGPAPPS
jgi:putative Mg2+ transporter-C (MgtC) family protein